MTFCPFWDRQDIVSSVDPLLANRLRVYNRRGLVLEAEVHPRIEAGCLRQVLAEWKARSVALKRQASLLFEPFGIYFYANGYVVARGEDGQPSLTIGFGDASDPGESPQSLMLGGTRFLMSMVGWTDVSSRAMLSQATSWFEQLGGRPEVFLPKCPGAMGIAREWVKVLLKDKVSTEVVAGLGAREIYGENFRSLGPAKPDAAEHAGGDPEVGDSDEESVE